MGNRNGMYVIEYGDTISGKQAYAFIKHEGQNIPCSWFKNLTATMEKNKTEYPRLGTTSLLQKTTGWSGKGEASMYYATSFLRQMAVEYNRTGKDVYVDIVVTNEDPTSVLGAQSMLLKNCNFDSIVLAKFDIDSDDPLDEDINFTFDDVELLQSFTPPAAMG